MNNNGFPPPKILIYGDSPVPTGFGRIDGAIGRYLVAHGYQVVGQSLQFDGLLPHALPYWIGSLQGKDVGQGYFGFARVVGQVAKAFQPDVIISVQDFPYHEALRVASAIDWSTCAHIVITPVDGVPINSQWVRVAKQFDALMTISEFGVEAFRQAGQRVTLCPPGVDTHEFRRLPDVERAALRERLRIPPTAFVVGVMAMNQGRKDFPRMVRGFAEAFRDAPDALLYLDCEKVSPGGWDIVESLVKPNRLDPARVLFREQAVGAGLQDLNARYNLLDLHMVIAHREGYGLPHAEAMATGIPSVTMDYCSGREIIGDNARGWLIPGTPDDYGTWGGATDYNADVTALTAALRDAYDHPAERIARGARGLAWVTQERTWERACLALDGVLTEVLDKRREDLRRKYAMPMIPMPQAIPQMPAGIPLPQIIIQGPVHIHANTPMEMAQALVDTQSQPVALIEQRADGREPVESDAT
jgi:glycosyltransferase involved in cell wall biosynthesis